MNPLDAQPTLQTHSPGSKLFGRYRLERLIARGKRGDLWEAQDERLNLPVAMKLLVGHPQQAELVRSGARAMELTHPGIVRTYDVLEEDSTVAIVTELVKGRSLAEMLRDKSPPWYDVAEVKRWAEELFSALDFAWGHVRLVHGDVRLNNLLIGQGGALKVMDFPFAGLREGKNLLELNSQSTAGISLPTLSPQLVMGEPPSHADDLYAAAASIYELLTGKPVFPGGNVIAQIERKVPPTVAARRAEYQIQGQPVPEDWERWLAWCLAKDRSDRPARAAEVLPFIQNADAPPPVSQTTASTAKIAAALAQALRPKPAWRNALTSPLGRAVSIGAVGLLAFQFFVRAPNQQAMAERRERMAELAKEDQSVAKEPAGGALSSELLPWVEACKARRDAWDQFVGDYELEPLSFTTDDERLLRDARKTADAWRSKYDATEARQAKMSTSETTKVSELATAILKSERDEKDMKTEVEKLDLWKRLQTDSLDPKLAEIQGYKDALTRIAKKIDLINGRIAQAKADAETARMEQEKAAQQTLVAAQGAYSDWKIGCDKSWADLQAQLVSTQISGFKKIADLNTFKQRFLTPDLPKYPAAPHPTIEAKLKMLVDQTAAEKSAMDKLVGEALARTVVESEKEIPANPLKPDALVADLPAFSAEKDSKKRDAATRAFIKKMQAALKEKNLYSAEPDGQHGAGSHKALTSFQKQEYLVANGKLDAPTVAKLGIADPDVGALAVEGQAMTVAARSNDDDEDGGGGGGGRRRSSRSGKYGIDYENNPPERGYYDKIGLGYFRLKEVESGKTKKDPVEWKKHLIWLDYCEWEKTH